MGTNGTLQASGVHGGITIYMYKQDLALSSLQVLICYKTQPANYNISNFIQQVFLFNTNSLHIAEYLTIISRKRLNSSI